MPGGNQVRSARVPLYPYEGDGRGIFFYSSGRAAPPDAQMNSCTTVVTPRSPKTTPSSPKRPHSAGQRPRSAGAFGRGRVNSGFSKIECRNQNLRKVNQTSGQSYFEFDTHRTWFDGRINGIVSMYGGWVNDFTFKTSHNTSATPQSPTHAEIQEEDVRSPSPTKTSSFLSSTSSKSPISPRGGSKACTRLSAVPNDESPTRKRGSCRPRASSQEDMAQRAVLTTQISQLSECDESMRPFSDFYLWCIKKFKSLTRSWRMLDSELKMTLNIKDFLASLKKHQFPFDPRYTFKLLNRDKSGVLPYYHFDPNGASDLATLVQWCNDGYGGVKKAFQKLDKDQNCTLTLDELHVTTKENGFTCPNAITVAFQLLDLDQNGRITIDEIGFLDRWKCPLWLKSVPDEEATSDFKQAVLKKHGGNPIKAWNFGLDPKRNMRISYEEFKTGCYAAKFNRDKMPSVWRCLDCDLSGWLSFYEFNAVAYDSLLKFKAWARRYGKTMEDAFAEIDKKQDGIWSKKDFKRVIEEANLSEEEGDVLFNGFEFQGQITLKSFKYLDNWDVDQDERDKELSDIITAALNYGQSNDKTKDQSES